MTPKLTRTCQPATGEPEHPSVCRATFTVEGQRGNQKFLAGGIYTLQADDVTCTTYLWEVTSSPPVCDYLLAGSTQPQARLALPGPGAYVVQLTVTQGNCRAQQRVILWVVTPVRLYRLPATGEPLRFDGQAEWPGDLVKALLEVDHNLPSAAQKAALDKANQPGAANPFLTRSDLSADGLTPNERDAIRAAENPSGQNSFITQSKLAGALPGGEPPWAWPLGVTQPQKEALDAAENPHTDNPFVTDSRLVALTPTPDQKAALDKADSPHGENAFVTYNQWQATAPTPDEKAALAAAQQPGATNPFITRDALPSPQLTPDQEAAVDNAAAPNAQNPFITHSQWQATAPTPTEKAALDAASEANATNRFATLHDVPDFSAGQQEAIRNALDPSAADPFVTKRLLPIGVTPDQRDALDHAAQPSVTNPIVTTNQWQATAPTLSEKAALDHAAQPSEQNPFVTQKQLPTGSPPGAWPIGMTQAQKEALDAAEEPTGQNPLITQSKLQSQLPIGVTQAQKEALTAAKNPSKTNAFITKSALPAPQLTEDQAAAVDHAADPNANNPFITQSQLDAALSAIPIHVIAAGTVDLERQRAVKVIGTLKVVKVVSATGQATLTFAGYREELKDDYIIHALPINSRAGENARGFACIQLVNFAADGFVLHMFQPQTGEPNLGLCMLEVREIRNGQRDETKVLEIRVASGADDAEERPSREVDLEGDHLDLGESDGKKQLVGLRFLHVDIPAQAMITYAAIHFKAIETSAETAAVLKIQGEAADNAASFVAQSGNLSSRVRTSAEVFWSPLRWRKGELNQTANIAALIQEIVNRSGWVRGNALAILVSGTGLREGVSYDRDSATAPYLEITYQVQPNTANNLTYSQPL